MKDASITAAWLRSGAGPMKDRRAPRGGDNAATTRDEIADALAELAETEEDDGE